MNNSATSKLFLFRCLLFGWYQRNGPLYVKVLLFSQQFCHLQKIAFHISAICGTDLAKESAIFTGQLEAVGLANFPKRDSWEKTANLLLLGHPSRCPYQTKKTLTPKLFQRDERVRLIRFFMGNAFSSPF